MLNNWLNSISNKKKKSISAISTPRHSSVTDKGRDFALLRIAGTGIKTLLNYFFLIFTYLFYLCVCLQKRSADRERFITPKIRRQVQVVGGERIWAPLKTQSEENKTSGAKHCCLDWIVWCELDKTGPQFSHLFLSDLMNTVFTPTSPRQPCQCILILNPWNNESWPSGTLLAPLSDTSGSPKQCKSLIRSHLLWMIFL